MLFRMGLKLMAEGKIDRACRYFEESQRRDPGIGTQYHIADCYEKSGRLALAWTQFSAVAELAKKRGSAEREAFARGRAQALEPRIGKVVITVPARMSEIPGLKISLDSAPLALRGRLDRSEITNVVDPGTHVLAVAAPERRSWQTILRVRAGQAVEVTILPLLPAAAPVEPVAKAGSAALRHPLAIAGGGISLMGIGAGIGFALASNASAEEREALKWKLQNPVSSCRSPSDDSKVTCAQIAEENTKSQIHRTLSIASFVIGGLAAAGTVAVVVWPEKSAGSPRMEAMPLVGPGGAAFALRGIF
jgi:hypothetical protein